MTLLKLVFHANGGNFENTNQTVTETVAKGSSFDLGAEQLPLNSNYTFKGWSLTRGGGQVDSGSIIVTGNVTYYAVWDRNPPKQITIKFNANNGKFADNLGQHDLIVDQGSNIRPENEESPTRNGNTFRGWSSVDGGQLIRGSVVVNDIAAYFAQWLPNPAPKTFTVTFDSNGGTPATQTKTVTDGGTLVLADQTAFTRIGNVFQGWSASTSGQVVTGTVVITANKPYYAIWKANPPATVDITFDANTGSFSGAITKVVSVDNGTSGVLTTTADATPTRNGKTFKGWSSSKNGQAISSTVTFTADTTYYAVWK